MVFEILSSENISEFIDYLKMAMIEEPDVLMSYVIDEEGIKSRISNSFFNSINILARTDNKIVGRIEYHFYGCIQDGYKMAYVDWVYVLKSYRHQGIAQKLFKEFERDCIRNNIDEYFLICAENEEADRFYKHFENVGLRNSPILRKNFKQ